MFVIRYATKIQAQSKFKRNKVRPFNLLKEGEVVKIKGMAVRHESVVKAPLSQQVCLCYHVFVEIRSINWRASTVWGRDFWIECEGGGKVLIKSDNVLPYLNESYRKEGFFSNIPEHIEKYLSRYGKSTSQGSLSCDESILLEGDEVVAVGVAKWKNKNTPDEYMILKTGGKAIYVSNLSEWLDYA